VDAGFVLALPLHHGDLTELDSATVLYGSAVLRTGSLIKYAKQDIYWYSLE